MRFLLALLVLSGCASGDPAPPAEPAPPPEAPFVETVWRLTSLDGEAPAEGVRPALIFTEASGALDMYDRERTPSREGWLLLKGESGVGPLHEPYRRSGDSLQIGAEYEYTRMSPEASIAQAKMFMAALAQTRSLWRDDQTLALIGAEADTLARFTADPPRTPGPLDDIEWVATSIDGTALSDSVRMTLAFGSNALGPGENDGFDGFGGYDGCNWWGSAYRLTEQASGVYSLHTQGGIMATARGCRTGVMELSSAFSRALYDARTVRHTGDRLALVDSSGAERAVFRRHEAYAIDLDALKGGLWRYQSSSNPYAVPGDGATLAFADSTFEGRNGCLWVRGMYRIDSDNLYLPEQRGGDEDCTPADRGTLRVIPVQPGKLSVTRDRLTLYDENGNETVYTR